MKTLADKGNKKAARVIKLADKYDTLLSTILIGNNIVNIAASSILTVLATDLFGTGGVAIATAIATVIILVFGEIVPKCIAKEKSEDAALSISPVLSVMIFILQVILNAKKATRDHVSS